MMSRIINGIIGGVMLFGFNLNGLNRLSFTTEAFIRSFGVALLVLPLQLMLLNAEYSQVETELAVTGAPLQALRMLFYAASWLLFPLAMIPVAKFLGHSERYVPYIVSYNWSSVGNYLLAAPLTSLFIYNPNGLTLMLSGTVGIWLLAVRFWLLRRVLGADWPQALALLIFDGLLTLLLTSLLAGFVLVETPAAG